MMNSFSRLVQGTVLAAAVLLAGRHVVTHAQEEARTLRQLAEEADFLVGAAAATWNFDSDARYGETLAREFNILTPENEAKWCFVQPQEGEYDFSGLDRLVEFAEANDMVVHAHTLVWHECFPEYLRGRDLTRGEAIGILREHISTVVGRYRGRIALWDVVNEAFEGDGQRRQSPWQEWIGDDYIDLAFQFAHEADPDAQLLYNDFDAEVRNAKSDAMYEMVRDLRLNDVPIDGVGLQMHIAVGEVREGGVIDPVSLDQNMRRLGQLGLDVHITELDVAHRRQVSEALLTEQAGHYYQILQACLNLEFCRSLTMWGVADPYSWLRLPEFYSNPDVAPLLFDDDFNPKPAYDALRDVLARHLGETPILSNAEVAAMLTPTNTEVVIGEPTRTDPAQLAPNAVHGGLYYAAFPVAITLDGDDSDWANIPRDTIFDGPQLPDDAESATFAAAADAENFYFLADIEDLHLTYGGHPPGSGWYEEDSIEFYLNATGDLTITSYAPGVAQIAILAANLDNDEMPDNPIIAGGNTAGLPVQAVVVETETGYRVEAAVPLQTDVWQITPAQGETLGFQVHLNGSSSDNRDTKLIWSANDLEDQSWTNPSVFGELMFWEAGT